MDANAGRAPVGEVVAASTTQFVAQCARLMDPPAFGSFVSVTAARSAEADDADPFANPAVADGTVFGIVSEARTASIEPGRRPAAYGLDAATLRREQPQLEELLATEFTALVVGSASSGRIRGVLPPRPPRVHALVMLCSPSEVRLLSESLDFLRTVVSQPALTAQDELAAAGIRYAAASRADSNAFLVRAGKEVALLLQRDFARVEAVLRKLTV
jgi:hypothetical protein